MTPLRAAQFIRETFAGGSVRVRVLDDRATIEREYPLLGAVNRAAATVERHRGANTTRSRPRPEPLVPS